MLGRRIEFVAHHHVLANVCVVPVMIGGIFAWHHIGTLVD